jgi:hypothetical protein
MNAKGDTSYLAPRMPTMEIFLRNGGNAHPCRDQREGISSARLVSLFRARPAPAPPLNG